MTWGQNVQYGLLFGVWKLLSLLPLRLMYVLSDGLYWVVYRLVGYRRKVVRKNLTECFPEKPLEEIERIERRFYHYFVDYIWETCKMASMTECQMRRRMVFENMEEVEAELRQGRSVSLYLGHYCNWEWVSSIPIHVGKDVRYAPGQIYHKIYNPPVNRLFLKNRGLFGVESVEMRDTLRWIAARVRQQLPSLVGYIADQAPVWNSIHHWVDFLHHDTPAFTGTERITKKYGFAAYYVDIVRERRGYYRARFVRLHDDPASLPDFALTDLYYRHLEATLRRAPEFYLWSHNRFKRTREEYNRRMAQKS